MDMDKGPQKGKQYTVRLFRYLHKIMLIYFAIYE